MEILVVGTGRSGTVSLTKWFNDLFHQNQISAEAAHEYKSAECYQAFDEFVKTGQQAAIQAISEQCCHSKYNVIVGNGYATLLPYIAKINKNVVLIHLQRRNKDAWIESSIKNAKFYPSSYKYFVDPDLLENNHNDIPRTAAFQVGEMTREAWDALTQHDKLSWHYDYTHKIIDQYAGLFAKSMHVYMEDLKDQDTLTALAKFIYPDVKNIPPLPKLNSHHFADIESCPEPLRPFAQWLLGNIDWEQAVKNPAYLATYSMNRFETWVGWSKTGRAQQVCPEVALTEDQLTALIKENLPSLTHSLTQLRRAKKGGVYWYLRKIKTLLGFKPH